MTPRHRLVRSEVAKLPTGSAPELLLSVQLEQAGIPFTREFRFDPSRRWRADFKLDAWGRGTYSELPFPYQPILVEIDGGGFVAGRHTRGEGFERDAEKASAAAILGFRVIRATPRQVNDGRALAWIRQALGLEAAA